MAVCQTPVSQVLAQVCKAADIQPQILANGRTALLAGLRATPAQAGAQNPKLPHSGDANLLTVQMDFKGDHGVAV
jgi:hypothetical protein